MGLLSLSCPDSSKSKTMLVLVCNPQYWSCTHMQLQLHE